MSSKNPASLRVSIALATYNGEKYLPEQLNSLAKQGLTPHELVVTDDGSTDATREILEAFSRNAPFPVLIHANPSRLGYRDNFLRAASLCSGELIAFCDQDDVWDSRKLETVVPAFRHPDVLLVIHDAKIVTADLRPSGFYRAPDVRLPFAVQYGNSMIFRADLPFGLHIDRPRSERDPNRLPLAHDEWIPFLAAALGRSINLRSALISYRQHGNNVCGFGGGEGGWIHPAEQSGGKGGRFRYRARCAEEHAAALKKIAEHALLPPAWRSRAWASIAIWERYARALDCRAKVYDSALTPAARAKAFIEIVSLRGYAKRQLGRKAFWRDACFLLRAEGP